MQPACSPCTPAIASRNAACTPPLSATQGDIQRYRRVRCMIELTAHAQSALRAHLGQEYNLPAASGPPQCIQRPQTCIHTPGISEEAWIA